MIRNARSAVKVRPDGAGVFSDQASRNQSLDGRVDFEGGEPHLLGESGVGHSFALQRNELQSYSQVLRLEDPLTGVRTTDCSSASGRVDHMLYAYSI